MVARTVIRKRRPVELGPVTDGTFLAIAMRMSEITRPTRREFTAQSVMALLSGVTITISGCGGSSPTQPSPPPGGGTADTSGSVSANHGHTATITGAQVSAGLGVTLQIRGSADHPHPVDLTNTEVVQIGGGTRVSKTSSTDGGHSHVVTFN